MIRSLRFRLSLWYVGILAATLSVFGGALYANVSTNLAQDIDNVLASQADGVAETLFAFWRAGRDATGHGPSGLSAMLPRDVREGRLPMLAARWAQETEEFRGSRAVRLLDLDGQSLQTSTSFLPLNLPVTPRAVAEGRQGRTTYETFNGPESRIRLVTHPVIEAGDVLYFVQVAASLRQADASLRRLRLWLWWLIPVTVAVTSAVGWFLATLALRPVGQITTKAQQIHAEQLHERIAVPKTGDELERLAATFNDMLARLEQAFRRLRQFSAAASHELRTPLTVLKGELEIALRKPRPPEEYRRVLTTQLEAINELTGIVEQLLTLARSETGAGAVDWRPVDLDALVRRVQEAWRPAAVAKGVEVLTTGTAPLWVRGESRLLERLVANLLDNALKHTPAAGHVTLRLDRGNGAACLTVQDTGPGIPAEELPTLFDRFFNRRPSAEGPASTGLGLGLCRWIAEAHQGRIEVSSAAGAGAAFVVRLPLAPHG